MLQYDSQVCSIEGEQWRAAHGFKGQYAVSTMGRVANARTGQLLQHITKGSGCVAVALESREVSLARLVLNTYDPLPAHREASRWVAHHIDGDARNNKLDNLRWVTKEDLAASRSTRCTAVWQVEAQSGRRVALYASQHAAARALKGVTSLSSINLCMAGHRRRAKGWRWEHASEEDKSRFLKCADGAYKKAHFIDEHAAKRIR